MRWRARAKRLHFGPLPLNQATPMRFRGARKHHSEPFGVARLQSWQSEIAVLGPQLAFDSAALGSRQRFGFGITGNRCGASTLGARSAYRSDHCDTVLVLR